MASGVRCARGAQMPPAAGAASRASHQNPFFQDVEPCGIHSPRAGDVRAAITSGTGRPVSRARAGRCTRTGTRARTSGPAATEPRPEHSRRRMTEGREAMLSRREMLAITPFAAAAAIRRSRRSDAAASQPSTAVTFTVPASACDCHTHIFGDPQRFPFAAGRTYTPETASVAQMRALHRALRTTRVVIVQPSVYGTDNGCTLDAIRQLAPNARGIAVIDDSTSDAALDDMHHGGIRGIRINLATVGQTDPELGKRRFEAAVARIGKRKWHIQMYTQLSVIAAMQKEIASSPLPVVFDHFGGAQASGGTS